VVGHVNKWCFDADAGNKILSHFQGRNRMRVFMEKLGAGHGFSGAEKIRIPDGAGGERKVIAPGGT
jgi:hypothetical protein